MFLAQIISHIKPLTVQTVRRNRLIFLRYLTSSSTCAEEPDLFDPKCKVALVTGGVSGIGFAAATELLCAGAKHVIITGLHECQGCEAANMLNNTFGRNKATFLKGNAACIVNLEDAFKHAVDKQGRIDLFINCAGICDGPQWEKEFATNVIGTVRGTLMSFKYLGKQDKNQQGVIINVAGTSGLEPLPPAPTLSACYHAIVGFSRSFGNKSNVEKERLRMCCLCPGFTQTGFIRKIGKRGLNDAMGAELEAYVKSSKLQKADVCGRAIMHLIRKGRTGSVWWIEGSRLFSVHFPKKESYSKLEAQYI